MPIGCHVVLKMNLEDGLPIRNYRRSTKMEYVGCQIYTDFSHNLRRKDVNYVNIKVEISNEIDMIDAIFN